MQKALFFLSTPGFGLAAAALVLIGILSPALTRASNSAASVESFRGATLLHTSRDATIVLITDKPDTRILLEESGLFEMDAVISTSDPLVAASISTAKLLIDVKGGSIVAYNEESREVLADKLPADRSKLAERVALALGVFQ